MQFHLAILAYLAVLGAALAGYSGVPLWAVSAAAIALASISYAEHADLYERSRTLGLLRIVNAVQLRSFVHAVLASGFAYVVGMGLSWL